MKTKIFSLLIAIMASTSLVFAESGTCGANLTWDLTDGVLTISGSGEMTNFTSASYVPWYTYRQSIASISLPEELATIGNYAFYGCSSITSIIIPNNLSSIGNYAFYNCSNLTTVIIPDNVTSIGNSAFYNCTKLKSVTIPSSVTTIGTNAFRSVANIVYHGTATGSPWGALSV